MYPTVVAADGWSWGERHTHSTATHSWFKRGLDVCCLHCANQRWKYNIIHFHFLICKSKLDSQHSNEIPLDVIFTLGVIFYNVQTPCFYGCIIPKIKYSLYTSHGFRIRSDSLIRVEMNHHIIGLIGLSTIWIIEPDVCKLLFSVQLTSQQNHRCMTEDISVPQISFHKMIAVIFFSTHFLFLYRCRQQVVDFKNFVTYNIQRRTHINKIKLQTLTA